MLAARQSRWALVTGGTDGIGKAIALRLAQQGQGVIVAGRSPEKGDAAARELRIRSGNDRVYYEQADLSLMREVVPFAARIAARWPRLHYLVLCAGIVRGRRVLTDEGVESNFAITYLSRFALTQQLLPTLAKSGEEGAAARLLIIGGAARNGVIHYDDINLAGKFSTIGAVAQFCEANDVFVVEQNRRIASQGLAGKVTISTLKVGAVRTGIRKQFPLWMKILVPVLIDPFLTVAPDVIARSAEELLLAPEHEGESGALFVQIRRMKPLRPGRRTHEAEEGRRLWELSESLVARALARGAA